MSFRKKPHPDIRAEERMAWIVGDQTTQEQTIAYWRNIIEKVTAPHDAAMVVSPERWAEALTWALDELEAKSK